jgi:hypothetical protein
VTNQPPSPYSGEPSPFATPGTPAEMAPGASAPRGTNAFAITSLILGILGCTLILNILAIIFGIVALRQIKQRGQQGKGMAIAGISLAVVWLVVIAAAIIIAISTSAGRDSSGNVTERGTESLSNLQTGDCVESAAEGTVVTTVTVLPCSSPHQAEVVGVFELPNGDYPGQSQVDEQASSGCTDRLGSYAPAATEDSTIELLYFSPSRLDWRNDREVICLALHPSATGSIRD